MHASLGAHPSLPSALPLTLPFPLPFLSPAPAVIMSATVDQVYELIGPEARRAVDAARKYRDNLAGVHALTGLQPSMVAADAAKLGIAVLRKDAGGHMSVGMFDLPALNIASIMLPKSECGLHPVAHQPVHGLFTC